MEDFDNHRVRLDSDYRQNVAGEENRVRLLRDQMLGQINKLQLQLSALDEQKAVNTLSMEQDHLRLVDEAKKSRDQKVRELDAHVDTCRQWINWYGKITKNALDGATVGATARAEPYTGSFQPYHSVRAAPKAAPAPVMDRLVSEGTAPVGSRDGYNRNDGTEILRPPGMPAMMPPGSTEATGQVDRDAPHARAKSAGPRQQQDNPQGSTVTLRPRQDSGSDRDRPGSARGSQDQRPTPMAGSARNRDSHGYHGRSRGRTPDQDIGRVNNLAAHRMEQEGRDSRDVKRQISREANSRIRLGSRPSKPEDHDGNRRILDYPLGYVPNMTVVVDRCGGSNHRMPEDRASGKCLYFSGFGTEWSENEIIKFFRQAGDIEAVSLLRYVDFCPQGSGCIQYSRMRDANWAWKNYNEYRIRAPEADVDSVIWISPANKEYILDPKAKGSMQMMHNLGFGARGDPACQDWRITPNSELHNKPWQRRGGFADERDLVFKLWGDRWDEHGLMYNRRHRDHQFLDVRNGHWPFVDRSKLNKPGYRLPELRKFNLDTPWNDMVEG